MKQLFACICMADSLSNSSVKPGSEEKSSLHDFSLLNSI